MKTTKKSKKKKIFIILFLIVALLVIGYLGYQKYFNNEDGVKKVKILKKIDGYGYTLDDKKTKLYKTYFNELNDILTKEEINYEDYAKTISKLFVIDFYTLNNKESKNDIGGLEFIKDEMKDNFIEEVRNTFYRYIKADEDADDLPEVSEILDTEVTNIAFTYNDKTQDENAYKVTIKWEYKEDFGYEKEANMILVKDDKKLYIIEMD